MHVSEGNMFILLQFFFSPCLGHFPFLNYFSSWVVPKEMTKCGKCLTDTAEALIEARKLEGGSVKVHKCVL